TPPRCSSNSSTSAISLASPCSHDQQTACRPGATSSMIPSTDATSPYAAPATARHDTVHCPPAQSIWKNRRRTTGTHRRFLCSNHATKPGQRLQLRLAVLLVRSRRRPHGTLHLLPFIGRHQNGGQLNACAPLWPHLRVLGGGS